MDHFAKPGDELALSSRPHAPRNFQGYTPKRRGPLWDGHHRISGFQNAYAQNHPKSFVEKAVNARGIATIAVSPFDETVFVARLSTDCSAYRRSEG